MSRRNAGESKQAADSPAGPSTKCSTRHRHGQTIKLAPTWINKAIGAKSHRPPPACGTATSTRRPKCSIRLSTDRRCRGSIDLIGIKQHLGGCQTIPGSTVDLDSWHDLRRLIFRKQTSTALRAQVGRGPPRCEQMRELVSRRSSAYTVEALLDRCEAVVDERFVLGIRENVGPVVFDGLANQFAHIQRINAVVDPFL